MAQSTHTAAALTPLTVTFDEQTVDLSVPQLSPLAELIPTILRSLGRMDVYGASAGFTVSTSSGQVLDQSLCLRDQGVRAGAALTLERAGQGREDQRFDDLVEAVGSAVETTVDPWTPLDSLQLSVYASAVFVGLASALLVSASTHGTSLLGADSSFDGVRLIAYPIIGIVGAFLLTGTAAVVSSTPPSPSWLAAPPSSSPARAPAPYRPAPGPPPAPLPREPPSPSAPCVTSSFLGSCVQAACAPPSSASR